MSTRPKVKCERNHPRLRPYTMMDINSCKTEAVVRIERVTPGRQHMCHLVSKDHTVYIH
ncbi:hypothetical protein SK128_028442, partial [Halocaridina rubra]